MTFAIASVAPDVTVKLWALGRKLLPFALVVIAPRSFTFATVSFLALAFLGVVGRSIAILALGLAFAIFATTLGSFVLTFGIFSTFLSFSLLLYSIDLHGDIVRRNWKKMTPTLLCPIPFEKALTKFQVRHAFLRAAKKHGCATVLTNMSKEQLL